MTAVTGDPQVLRTSASALSARSSELRRAAESVRSQSRVAGSGWQGTAAVRFAAASGQAHRALAATGERLSRVARATDRYADELDSAQGRARGLQRRHDLAERDLTTRTRAAASASRGPGSPDPRDLESAAELVRGLATALGGVAAEQAAAARRFRSVLEESGPGPDVLGWRSGAFAAARATSKTIKLVRQVRSVVSFLKHLNLARSALKSGDLLLRSRALEDAVGLVRKMVHGPFSRFAGPARGLSVTARFLAKLSPAATVYRGVTDAITGGGYTGWRGNTTRVLGGLAAAAAVVGSTPAVAFPPVAIGVAAALLCYNAWKAGNWIYDNRAQLRTAAVTTYRAAKYVGDQLIRAHVAAFRRGVSLATSFAHLHERVWQAGLRKSGLALDGVATISPAALGALRRAKESGAAWRQTVSRIPKQLGPLPVVPGAVDRFKDSWPVKDSCPDARYWPNWAPSPLLKTAYPLVCQTWFGAAG